MCVYASPQWLCFWLWMCPYQLIVSCIPLQSSLPSLWSWNWILQTFLLPQLAQCYTFPAEGAGGTLQGEGLVFLISQALLPSSSFPVEDSCGDFTPVGGFLVSSAGTSSGFQWVKEHPQGWIPGSFLMIANSFPESSTTFSSTASWKVSLSP